MTMPGDWLRQHAADDFCYLTTTGRRTGNPHEIEIWFAVDPGTAGEEHTNPDQTVQDNKGADGGARFRVSNREDQMRGSTWSDSLR